MSWTKFLVMLVLIRSQAVSQGATTRKHAFSFGADISFVEGRGGSYKDENGLEKDICQIMADHHFDNIRLRIFVNPEAQGGYSRQGACGLDETVKMAKRIKAAGMEFTLDFHYSDTWADPDKQYKPSAWKNLSGKDLEDAVYEYTTKVLTTLKEAGATPDMVQVGNEINHGMIWPDGKVLDNATEENWKALMGLYKAGERAVRETLPDARIMVHLALGGENTLCHEFLNHMIKYGAGFDVIGLSYYEQWHETYDDLKANLYDLAKTYQKPLCICEYGANRENIKTINDIVRSVPNQLGYGTMAWEPLGVLFSRDGKASTNLFGIYDDLYRKYSDPAYAVEVSPPFIRDFQYERPLIGADISWAQQQEDRGTMFSDHGVTNDLLKILADNKFNWIRLRLFVDPTATNGYSRQGYCDLDHTLSMAKRVKAAGMKFLLDFHYSDTWADPGKQFTPASWARFHGSALEGQVYKYSNEVIKRFMAEGVTPDMVQIGNEINNGMVWPQGKIDDIKTAESFCVLLRGASAGVRAADPSIKIMVHIACGGQNERSVAFFDKIISRDVKFDVIGQSYYPKYHGTLEELKNNLTDLATRYKKPVVVVEYQQYRKEVNEIVKNLPAGLGWGTFIWEATSPQWGDLFDRTGATTENMAIYLEFFRNYNHSKSQAITITRHIAYREGNSKAWRLDLAMPADSDGKLRPALVIVHGGGWAAGSKSVDVFQRMMTNYAEKGYVTINVEYRLTGEAPFPACIEDVKCAVRWLRAHSDDYHVDPNRIGAYGHSAGAHLALMLAMAPASAGLEGDGGWTNYSSRVNAAVGGSPPTELGRDVPMAKKEWWPIGYISADQPPLLLIQGASDRIVRPELTENFVEKMKAKGADIEYLKVEGGHSVAYDEQLEVTAPAIEKFFAKYLKPELQ